MGKFKEKRQFKRESQAIQEMAAKAKERYDQALAERAKQPIQLLDAQGKPAVQLAFLPSESQSFSVQTGINNGAITLDTALTLNVKETFYVKIIDPALAKESSLVVQLDVYEPDSHVKTADSLTVTLYADPKKPGTFISRPLGLVSDANLADLQAQDRQLIFAQPDSKINASYTNQDQKKYFSIETRAHANTRTITFQPVNFVIDNHKPSERDNFITYDKNSLEASMAEVGLAIKPNETITLQAPTSYSPGETLDIDELDMTSHLIAKQAKERGWNKNDIIVVYTEKPFAKDLLNKTETANSYSTVSEGYKIVIFNQNGSPLERKDLKFFFEPQTHDHAIATSHANSDLFYYDGNAPKHHWSSTTRPFVQDARLVRDPFAPPAQNNTSSNPLTALGI
jgi:hypothetical protein